MCAALPVGRPSRPPARPSIPGMTWPERPAARRPSSVSYRGGGRLATPHAGGFRADCYDWWTATRPPSSEARGTSQMVRISAFADEISKDPVEQLDVLEKHGVRHIEFRSIHGTNVLDLSEAQHEEFRSMLRARG